MIAQCRHIVSGAGKVRSTLAGHLRSRGERVRIVRRSAAEVPLADDVERAHGDGTDAGLCADAPRGAGSSASNTSYRGERQAGLTAALLLATLVAGCHARRPHPPADLVDVARRVPGALIDLRYATPDNFLGAAVYACARCLLRADAAEALARAEAAVEARGYRLRLWDCYRPPAVQRRMWQLVPDERYVADPRKGSVHARGGAVDVTLAAPDGGPVEMPTGFDDFSPRAAAAAPAAPAAAAHRAVLRAAMEDAGFAVLPTEWWHFDLRGSRAWTIVDADPCTAGS